MEKETRQKISEDYKKVNGVIGEILSCEKPNFVVIGRHYISPTIIDTSLGVNDNLYGELVYFQEIRDCLEEILINEKTSLRIFNAPKYVQKFFGE